LRCMAKQLSRADCDVVSLHHEFGIWGGEHGEHLNAFLDELEKPVVSTLHTTFAAPRDWRVRVSLLRRLIDRSASVVVLTEASKESLCGMLKVATEKISVIPHGIPDIPFTGVTPNQTDSFDASVRLLSLGFFRPDKGLEAILVGVWMLKERGLRVMYTIAGQVQEQFPEQAEYSAHVERLVSSLNLNEQVSIRKKFLSVEEQIRVIRGCHFGIFAYQEARHSSSGAVPLMLGTGRPVICTPFEYAIAKQRETEGVIVAANFGARGIADAIYRATKHYEPRSGAYEYLTRSTHIVSRSWIWSTVARGYLQRFQEAMEHISGQ
jgi:glycosyltransferase involved in cell wall biosynthesis